MRTITVGNAGRSLPGVSPVRHLGTEQAAAREAAEWKRLHELGKAEGAEGAEPKGLLEQGIEAGAGLVAVIGGAPNPEKVAEKVGKHNPVSADERTSSKKLEKSGKEIEGKANEAKEAVEEVTEWPAELGKLLSKSSLERFGKIVAGAILLIVAVVLFIKIMGGPSLPLPVKV